MFLFPANARWKGVDDWLFILKGRTRGYHREIRLTAGVTQLVAD